MADDERFKKLEQEKAERRRKVAEEAKRIQAEKDAKKGGK
jgi:hypothetical protein